MISGGPKPKKCHKCSRPSEFLCDYKIGLHTKTCDAPMCKNHAHRVSNEGSGLDYCDGHYEAMKPEAPKTEKCRTCHAEIIWLKHKETGKPAPIDAEAVAKGNILINLESGQYRIATADEIRKAKEIGKRLHTNHFSMCIRAAEHREAAIERSKRERRDKANEALFAPKKNAKDDAAS